jgi:beta-glucosidase
MNTKLFCRLSAGIALAWLLVTPAFAQNKATTSAHKTEDWWVNRFAANVVKMNKGDIDLLLIGDSITHGWESQRELYEKYFGAYKMINLGFGGDQTAHVLWRLEHMPLDKISPKVAMLMIGTNNIGHKDGTNPKEAAEGIVAIVKKLQKHYPKLQIIVLNVFPRDEKPDGDFRKKVNEINAALPAMLEGLKNVYLTDINAGFLDENGILPKSIMNDSLHPDAKGYEYWGEKITPIIKEKFQQYDQ